MVKVAWLCRERRCKLCISFANAVNGGWVSNLGICAGAIGRFCRLIGVVGRRWWCGCVENQCRYNVSEGDRCRTCGAGRERPDQSGTLGG